MKKSIALGMVSLMTLLAAQPLARADKGSGKTTQAGFYETNLSDEDKQYVREVNQACGRGDTDEVPSDPTKFKCPMTAAGKQKLLELGKDPRAQKNPDLRDFAFFAASVMAGKKIVNARAGGEQGEPDGLTANGGNERNALSVEDAKAFDQAYQCEADKSGIRLTGAQSGLRYHPTRLSSAPETECVECNAKKKDAALSAAGLNSGLVSSLSEEKSTLTKKQFADVQRKGWDGLKLEVRDHSNRLLMERLRTEAYLMGYFHDGDRANAKNSREFSQSVSKALSCPGKTSAEAAENRRTNEALYGNVERETGDFYNGKEGEKRRNIAQRAHMQTVTYAAACRETVGARINALRQEFGLGASELQKYQELVAASYKSPVISKLKKEAKSFGNMLGDMAYSFRPVVLPLVALKLPGYPNQLGGKCSEFYRTQAYRNYNESAENQECQKKLLEMQTLDAELRGIDAAHPNLSAVTKDGELLSQRLVKTSQVMTEFPELKNYAVDATAEHPTTCMSQLQTPVENGMGLKAWGAQDRNNSDYQATVKLYRDFVTKEAVQRASTNAQALCKGDQDSLTAALLQSPAFADSFYSCDRPANPLLGYYAGLQDSNVGEKWPVDAATQGDPGSSSVNSCQNRRSSTWVACAQGRWEVNAQKNRTILAGVESVLGESMSMGGVGAMIPGMGVKAFASQGLKSMTKGMVVGAGFGAAFHVAMVEPQLKQARAQAAQSLQSIDLGLGGDLTRGQAEQAIADLPGWMEAVIPGAILGGVAEVSISKISSDLAAKASAGSVASKVRGESVRLGRFERDSFKEAWTRLKSKSDLVGDEQKLLTRILDGKEAVTKENAHVLDGLSAQANEIMAQKRADFQSNMGKLMSRIDAKRTALNEEIGTLEKVSSRSADQEKRLANARREMTQLDQELGPKKLGDRVRSFLGLKDNRLLGYWDDSLKGERGEFLQLMSEFEHLGCTSVDFRSFIGFVATNCRLPKAKWPASPRFSAKCAFAL